MSFSIPRKSDVKSNVHNRRRECLCGRLKKWPKRVKLAFQKISHKKIIVRKIKKFKKKKNLYSKLSLS